MRVENEDRDGLAKREELHATTENTLKCSKIAYTREFLLSFADLDVFKRLPREFDPSVLCELEMKDTSKGILEPWKGSGVLYLPRSSNSGCEVWSTKSDCTGDSRHLGGRSDYLSPRLKCERNSAEIYGPDIRRRDDLTQSLLKASGCKAEVMGQKIQQIGKNGCYQLSKSENPYRPPHFNKMGSTKFGAESLSNIEEIDCISQGETCMKGHTIFSDEEHEIKSSSLYSAKYMTGSLPEDDSSDPIDIVKPSSEASDFSVALEAEIMSFGSKKVNLSIFWGELNEEPSGTIIKGNAGSSLTGNEDSLSTVLEKEISQPLATKSESLSGELYHPRIGVSSHIFENSSEGTTGNSETDQSHRPISQMGINEQTYNREFSSGHRGSCDRISKTDDSVPYEFPIGYDFLASILDEHRPTGINTADAVNETDLYEIEDSFDDMWSKISAIIPWDQETELAYVDEYDQTTESEVQVCLADEDSLISIDYPASSEHPKVVSLNGFNDIADSDSDIHLPDENCFYFVDDLIAPHCSKLMDDRSLLKDQSLMTSARDNVAKQPGAPLITDHEDGSSIRSLEALPFPQVTASMALGELDFSHSSWQNPCTNCEMPAFQPSHSLEPQVTPQTPFFDPITIPYWPVLCYYSCINLLHQPSRKTARAKSKEFNCLAQYSVLQQPTNFPLQNQ